MAINGREGCCRTIGDNDRMARSVRQSSGAEGLACAQRLAMRLLPGQIMQAAALLTTNRNPSEHGRYARIPAAT